MGWYHGAKTQEGAAAEALEGFTVLAQGWGPGHDGDKVLYAAVETKQNGKAIVVCLVNSERGMWGYKPMDESMGPYYYDVPAAVMKAATPGGKYANAGWRAKVLAMNPKISQADLLEVA